MRGVPEVSDNLRPWSQLAKREQAEIRRQYVLTGSYSVNGAPGWYRNGKPHGIPEELEVTEIDEVIYDLHSAGSHRDLRG